MFDKSIGKLEMSQMEEDEFYSALQSYPLFEIEVNQDIDVITYLTEQTNNEIYSSKGEAKRALEQNAVSINKEKVTPNYTVTDSDRLFGKYTIVSKGKKNHFIIKQK